MAIHIFLMDAYLCLLRDEECFTLRLVCWLNYARLIIGQGNIDCL